MHIRVFSSRHPLSTNPFNIREFYAARHSQRHVALDSHAIRSEIGVASLSTAIRTGTARGRVGGEMQQNKPISSGFGAVVVRD